MNLAVILMEMAAFSALFTVIVLPAYQGDKGVTEGDSNIL